MKASKRPRRDERRKAREQKRGKVHFLGTFDNFAGRGGTLNDSKTHCE